MERTTWKHLSRRTRALLDGELDDPVAVTEAVEGVTSALLAAMANAGGGTVLVGIGAADGDGGQVDRVVGCAADGAARARIDEAAATCLPGVPHATFVENTARLPMLRVEVGSAGLHATPAGAYPLWTGDAIAPLGPEELTLRAQEAGLASILDRQRRALAALEGQVAALRAEVREARAAAGVTAERVAAIEEAAAAAAGRLAAIEEVARDAVARVRALARHLGAEDRLRSWERRQLRTVMATVLDLAQRRGGRPADQADVMDQIKRTWSRVYDWVNDEVVDQLQREAQELIARTPPGDEAGDDDEDDEGP